MALFPITAEKVQLSTDAPVATDSYVNGVLCAADNSVARAALSGGAQWANGLLMTALGQVVYVDATAGLPVGTQYVNGIPLDPNGAMCVAFDAAAASWSSGLPFAANGAIAGTGFSPLSLFAGGEQGVLYDMSNAASRFQDSAGTVPVAASGDPFGRILDLSGRGNHAGQATTTSRPQYTLASGLSSALFDGTDDSWQTFANLDLSGTDKVTVIAGVRKLSDAAAGIVVELGPSFATAGTFAVQAPGSAAPTFAAILNGSSIAAKTALGNPAPMSAVLFSGFDIAGATVNDEINFRVNGLSTAGGSGPAGTGNLINAPMNIGRRNNASIPFNGHLYSLIVIGRLLTAPELANAERWTAQRCGVTLP